MGRIAFLAVLLLCLPHLAAAQEHVKAYASETISLFNAQGSVVERTKKEALPPIPPEGISAKRLKMGLVEVQLAGRPYIFNHVQLEMTGSVPKELKGSCNKVRSAPGDKRNTNIGMGIGDC